VSDPASPSARASRPVAVYFVRHGESLANLSDRNGTRRPEDSDRLTDLGWEQARALGRRLEGEGLEVIVASTLRRAQETAQGIAEVLDLPIESDPDLREWRQADDFYAASPDYRETGTLNWMPTADPDFAPPGADSFNALATRARRVQERLAERAAANRVLAVSHFAFMHFFLGVTLFGDDFAPRHLLPLYMAGHANTGITIFEHREQRVMDGVPLPGWTLTTWNDQAHL
jgi:broad specificity phosphatase PhoE